MSVSKASEQIAVIATIDPASYGPAVVLSDYVDMTKWEKIMGIVFVGTFGLSSVVDATFYQAKDGSGTGSKVVGSPITTLTDAGSDDNKQAVLNLDSQQLDRANDYDFVVLNVTVTDAACLVAAVILGINPRFAPASDHDLASVDEIVN